MDFGIIVDAAVILVENIYRNFQARPEAKQANAAASIWRKEKWGPDPTRGRDTSGLDRYGTTGCGSFWSARLQVDRAVFFSTAIIVAAFHPAVHDARRRRPDLRPDGADLLLMQLVGALLATFTVTPMFVSLSCFRSMSRKSRPSSCGQYALV